MDTCEKTTHELMEKLAAKIERCPEEKRRELHSYLSGCLAALELLLEKTA